MTHLFNHRVNQPDHRDRRAAVAAPPVNTLPLTFDLWQHYEEIPRWDQGQEGSCGGHALARACQHEEQKAGTTFDTANGDRVSPAYAYWSAREIMGTTGQDSGVDNRSLFQGLHEYGWVHEGEMPYKAGDFATPPSTEACDNGESHADSTYGLVTPAHGLVRGTLVAGKAIVIGFSVPDYFEELSAYNPAQDYLKLPTAVSGFRQFIGGHDVAITGYDYSCTHWPTHVFVIDNSYGANWGLAFNAPSGQAGRFAMDARWLSNSINGQKLVYDLTTITDEH